MPKFFRLSLFLMALFTLGNFYASDSDSTQGVMTVAQARQADNKERVTLVGMVVQRDNDYYLRDLTGQIKLDFPKERNLQINTVSRVKITGKIKTNLLRLISKSVEPTVRVKSIEVVQSPETSSDTSQKK